MFKSNQLALSVKLACAVGALSTVGFATQAVAQETSAEPAVEKIQVTGSRIKRTELEGAAPVISITAADIKLEGDFTVADALRSSSLNSFGSFSERSGSSSQSQATINLRGAGSRRTLVLLNGRRFPGSPTLGGASANLNAVPMAAVERIDIMTEGASSIYGSDAMAGVVNIILKEDFEGLSFNLGAGMREQDSGTTSSEFSIVGGFSNDKGNVTFSFDHQKRDGISDAARDFTKAKIGDFDGDGDIQAYTADTVGWSYYGATVLSPDFAEAQSSPLCDSLIAEYGENTFRRVDADEDWGEGSEYCMYAFGNVSYNTASIDRNTLYVSADYEVMEEIEWFGQAMFVQNSSFGRYAPPAAPWENMAADNPHNPYGVDDAYGLFRWVGIGTRDGNVDDYNIDLTTGLRGLLDWNNASWEFYYHRNTADNKSVGQYYLSYSGLAYNEQNGIDLGSDEGVENMKATTLQESSSTFDQFFAGIGFDFGELAGGVIAHYVGAEYFEQTYADIYDGQSGAGLIGGSSGNSSEGSRDVTALFFETALPVTDTLEVNVKARYDDYSDFGDNVSPSLSARWEVADDVIIRGSYSESFRAPGLDLLNAARTFSAERAIDYTNGATTSRQYDTYYTQNSELDAETSDYTNLGVAWDVSDNLSLKLDYFQLAVENVIQSKSLQRLLSDEAAGLITAVSAETDTSDETFYLKRASSGALIEAGTSYYNGIGFEIEGIDFSVNGNLETSFGDFRFQNVNSFVLSYENEVGGIVQDTAGWSGSPEFKSVATFVWNLKEHTFAWNITYTDSTSEFETAPKDADGNTVVGPYDISGKLDSWIIHNLTYTFDMASLGAISLAVNNLTDEDPVLSSAGTWDNQDLYNNFGRDFRVNYQITF